MNREEVLADFQACTGIDDVAICLEHLEKTDWNLLTAVHRAMPEHSQTLPSERYSTNQNFLSSIDAMSSDDIPTSRVSPSNSVVRTNDASDFPINAALNIPLPSGTQSIATVDSLNKRIDTEEASDQSDIEDLTESYHDEDFLIPDSNSAKEKQRFLITNEIEDEVTGTILFNESFINRYGHCHPMFYHGNLDAALREATQCSAKDRKLLAIYLHHDVSVLTNIFCQQVLCSESVVTMLSLNFVVWGWDCTFEANRQMMLASVNRSFGAQAVATIRNFDKDRYPVIILMSRSRSTTEISQIIYGINSVDETIGTLLHAVESYHAQQTVDIREEEERDARERVIQEQNQAYQESLRADMAKDEAKKAIEIQKKRDEDEKLASEAKLIAERRRVALSLPPEPITRDGVCTLRCRLPNGKIASRKFLQETPLKVLYDFLFSEGYNKDQYKILFSYPKKDVTELHRDTEAIGRVFNAQDTLIVESR